MNNRVKKEYQYEDYESGFMKTLRLTDEEVSILSKFINLIPC